MKALIHLLVTAFVLLGAAPSDAVEVTACGQEVPPGAVGTLQGDLFCEGDGAQRSAAVRLGNGATLDLQGRSLAVSGMDAVRCSDRNPGERCSVTSTGAAGMLSGDGGHGIVAYNVDLDNLVVTGFATALAGPLGGIGGRELRATNVAVQQNATATSFWHHASIEGSTFSDNGSGIAVSAGAEVRNSIIADNANTGLRSDAGVQVENVTITGNDSYGVHAFGRAVLIDSTVAGDADAYGGSYRDIISEQRPVLVNSTCGRSAGRASSPWGVCALD